MPDGADLLHFERAAHLQDDGGGRIGLVAGKQRAFRNDEVDAGSLNAVNRADGAGPLAFQRAHVIDVLDEAGGAERVRLVEDFVADAAALGHAAFGELHA